jgi:membrane protease YdiL (CAAX protease family)
VFFAALHGNLAAMAPIVFLGIFLAYAYERTGSLWTPIGMHALSNAMNLVPIMFGA